MRLINRSLISITLAVAACKTNPPANEAGSESAGDGDCNGPDNLVSLCETAQDCVTTSCADEREAIEEWEAAQPSWPNTCAEECGGDAQCETNCQVVRQQAQAAWLDQGEPLVDALNACKASCTGFPAEVSLSEACAVDPQWCAEIYGILLADGVAAESCECYMEGLFGQGDDTTSTGHGDTSTGTGDGDGDGDGDGIFDVCCDCTTIACQQIGWLACSQDGSDWTNPCQTDNPEYPPPTCFSHCINTGEFGWCCDCGEPLACFPCSQIGGADVYCGNSYYPSMCLEGCANI